MNVKGQQDRSLEKEKRETHIDYETLSNAKRTDFWMTWMECEEQCSKLDAFEPGAFLNVSHAQSCFCSEMFKAHSLYIKVVIIYCILKNLHTSAIDSRGLHGTDFSGTARKAA